MIVATRAATLIGDRIASVALKYMFVAQRQNELVAASPPKLEVYILDKKDPSPVHGIWVTAILNQQKFPIQNASKNVQENRLKSKELSQLLEKVSKLAIWASAIFDRFPAKQR